jgi:excisionase family DNA binding protein
MAPPKLRAQHRPAAADPALGRQLYKVTDAMVVLSISRSVIYEEIRFGRLRSVKRGRSRLISAAAISDYVALLERETRAA